MRKVNLVIIGTIVWASSADAATVDVTIGAMPNDLIAFDDAPSIDINSSNAAPVAFLGDFSDAGYVFSPVAGGGGAVVKGGAHLRLAAAPFGDASNYMAVGMGPGTEKISFAPEKSFSLYWGSIDPTNKIDFYSDGNLVASVTGAQLAADYPKKISANGDQHSIKSNVFITFSGFTSGTVDEVVLSSRTASFEFDLAKATPVSTVLSVPEPSTWAMMGIGFAALSGFAGFRRRPIAPLA